MFTREIYLDNSATTRPFDEVTVCVAESMAGRYYNPSSPYGPAQKERERLGESRKSVAALAGLSGWGVAFTSGGTESNHLAIRGALAAMRPSRRRLVTTAGEHPSVMRVFDALEEQGYAVERLPLDETGQARPGSLDAALRPDTALVSVMHVNNETGAVMPLGEMAEIVRREAPEAVFHADGVQALGRVKDGQQAADLYTVSSHKIHGPKGVGALCVRPGIRILPMTLGGGQEEGMRAGTENTPGIFGFAQAARIYLERRDAFVSLMRGLKSRLGNGILELIPDAFVNGPGADKGAPHILNVSFPGLRGEALLHALESEGIYVSTGAACSSRKRALSPVLSAMGLPPDRIESAVRFSLSPMNTAGEIEAVLERLPALVTRLRRFGRRK